MALIEEHPVTNYLFGELRKEVVTRNIIRWFSDEKIPDHYIPPTTIMMKKPYTITVGVVCSNKNKKLESSKKLFNSILTKYLRLFPCFKGDRVVCLVSEEKKFDGNHVHRLILELPFGLVQVFSSYEENSLKEIFSKLEDPSIFNKKSIPISSMFKALMTGTKPESRASN